MNWFKDWLGFSSAPYTAVSRKVVGKNVHATSPKGSMGYWSCRTYFNTRKHTLHADIVPFDSFKFLRKTVN